MSSIDPDKDFQGSGQLERELVKLFAALESAIEYIVTTVGSYARGYMHLVWVILQRLWRIAVRVSIFLVLPYAALGGVGEYLAHQFPLYLGLGTLGWFLIIAPPLAFLTAVYFCWLRSRSQGAPSRNGVSQNPIAQKLAVPVSIAGKRYWFYVVLASVALTFIVEAGWYFDIEPFTQIHDTFLIWPNVWLLDQVIYWGTAMPEVIATLASLWPW